MKNFEKQYKMFEKYVDKYAFNDGVKREVSGDYLLREWKRVKEPWFEFFGPDFEIVKEVTTTKSIDEMVRDLEDNCDIWGIRRMFDKQLTLLDAEIDNLGLYDIFDANTLVKNRWPWPTAHVTINGKKLTLQKGASIQKFLGKLVQYFPANVQAKYEEFRIEVSKATNQKKLAGMLHLSIAPMAYATMSDDTTGWNSCMSWADWGCYRQGTVEMLNSDLVFVAYLTSKEDMVTKKWRELIVVDRMAIANIKSYPYYSEELTKLAMDMAKEVAEARWGEVYDDTIVNWEDCEDERRRPSYETNYMYNDFDNRSNSHGWLYYAKDYGHEGYYIHYSGDSECMSCGDLNIEVADGTEESLVCENCYVTYECENCGEHIYNEDDIFELDEQRMCEHCYDRYAQEELFTREVRDRRNLWEHRLYLPDGEYETVYIDHRSSYTLKYLKPDYEYYYALTSENFTEEGLEWLEE